MFQPLPSHHPNPPPQLPHPPPPQTPTKVFGPRKFRRRRFLFARLVGCHPADVLLGAPPCCPRCLFQQPETLPTLPPLLTSANLMFLASQFQKCPLHHLLHETILIRQGFLFCFWFVFGVLLLLLAVLKLCLLKNPTSRPESQPASQSQELPADQHRRLQSVQKSFSFLSFVSLFFFLPFACLISAPPPHPTPPHFFSVPSIDLIWKCPIAFI